MQETLSRKTIQEINAELKLDTFTCNLCGEQTPFVSICDWKGTDVCLGCYMWLIRQDWSGQDEAFVVDYPEDWKL